MLNGWLATQAGQSIEGHDDVDMDSRPFNDDRTCERMLKRRRIDEEIGNAVTVAGEFGPRPAEERFPLAVNV